MSFLTISFIIMISIFVSYVSFIMIKFGILPSISDSYYKLSTKLKPLFTLYCWGFALPAAIIGLTLSEGSPFQFLIFLAVSGIMFVGASPNFKYGMDKSVHTISAIIGVVFSQLFIISVFPDMWYVPVIFTVLSLLMFIFKKSVKEIWWIEIFAFTSICYTYGVKILELYS